MAYRRPVTAEQKEKAAQRRADQLADLHDQLTAGVTALRDSSAWTAWLDTAAKFHKYSLNNQILIGTQRPAATLVAGYGAWKSGHGRQVRKGEKGIRILAPMSKRVKGKEADASQAENPDESGGTRVITGFRAVSVFDVTQTEGDPLPERVQPEQVDGQAPAGLHEALVARIEAAGFTLRTVDAADLIAGAEGVTNFTTKTVTIHTAASPADQAATLAHELGHVLMHEPKDGGRPDCRGIVEVEAESTAYLVAAAHGMDTSRYSFAYLAGWAERADDPAAAMRATAERVRSAASQILAATDPEQVTATTSDAQAVLARASAGRLAPAAADGLQDAAALSGGASGAGHSTGSRFDELRAVTADAQAWFTGQAPDALPWQAACAERGIDPVSATRLGIGWAEDSWTGLTDHLHQLGHSDAALVAAGVSKQARTGNLIDVFADRVTFPLTGPDGEVTGFTGRAITSGNNTPKYLNTAANPVFNKSETMYGTDAISGATRSIVITEGPWDAAAVTYATSGRHVGVAASGTAFTDAHAQQLAATGQPVTVWMDPDQAGQDAAVRAHGKLANAGVHDARYTNTAVLDPSAYHEAAGAVEVQAAVTARTIPLTRVVIDQELDQVAGRGIQVQVEAVRGLGPVLQYTDKDTRGQLAAHISERTGLQATTVVDALTQGAPPPRGRPKAATKTSGRQHSNKKLKPKRAVVAGQGR